jgi:hypothetical protein
MSAAATAAPSHRHLPSSLAALRLSYAPPPARPSPRSRAAGRRAAPPPAARGGGEPDVSPAFRFTLGIEGFDDALIPRYVGALGLALLAGNHLLSGDAAPAQARAEALGAALAAVAAAAPGLERRLAEAAPGRGRGAAAERVEGGANVFALDEALPEAARRELAWASYALLKNCNVCAAAACWRVRADLSRGALGAGVVGAGGAPALAAAAEVWAPQATLGAAYCADRGEMARRGLAASALVPAGAQSALVVPLGGGGDGALLLLSDRPRALSSKERAWAKAIAAKLRGALLAEE